MANNAKLCAALMVAFVMVATMTAPTMAVRPMLLRQMPENLQMQQLVTLMLEVVAAHSDNNKDSVLRCIPQYNRCGPAMDGVPCCEPYTCSSQYYGSCS
ncbi:hypothetical protein RND81_05G150900 [Saponaria officinalis]|uniref:Uncharacterized protein n=1 Tax=Saponaria officinalis TaxID=3572 RepID=A0AAW1KW01_SAPOF